MINVKAEIEDGGVKIDMSVSGTGTDLLDEAYASIHAIVQNIKDCNKDMHTALLDVMAHDMEWACMDERKDGVS